jgi:drug/metabolite transporter (DMT)-like permease
LLLIFGCSLSWAALDLTRKLLAPHMSPLQAVFWVAAGQAPVVAVWAANAPGEALTARYALVAGGSVVLNVVANTAFVAALARAPFSLTVPLLSLIPVMTAGFAMPLLGERLTAAQGLGVLAVVAGAVLLGGASAQEGTLAAWWRAARSEPGTALMLLVAVCWALALPLDKMGVQMVGAPRHGVVLCLGVALGTLAIMLGVHRHGALRVKRAAWGVLAAAIAVAAAGLVLQLLAIRVAPVGIVEAVKRAVGNLSALLLGAAMFREGLGWRKAVALLAMIGGVMLILLP